MPPLLTEIERKILDYMVEYLRDNTYQPSIREIGRRFDIKSTKTVSEHLQAMAEKGFLERDPGRSRGIKILGVDLGAETVSVPLYADVPDGGRDGLPTSSADRFFNVDRRLAGADGGFFLRAAGDELAAIGVEEGDYLLVQPVTVDQLEEGAVVVVRQAGGPRFRRFSRNGQGIFLQSLRAGDPRVAAEDPARLEIVGRLSALYRRMDGAGTTISLTAH